MGSKSLVSHWNLLIDMCDTEYLIMASDDDVYDSRFLEEMDKLVTRYPMVDLFRSRVRRITAQGEPFCEDPPVNEYDSLTEFLFQMYNCPRLHCIANFLFKTETLKTNGSFMDLPVAWFSDDATTMICAENGVCNTADILFSFRESGINISNVSLSKEKNGLKKIDATMQFYDWFTHYYERHYNASSAVNQVKWQQIKSGVRDRVFGQLIPYSKRLGFIKFKSLYHWLDRYDFFSEKRKLFVFIGVRLKAFIFNKHS